MEDHQKVFYIRPLFYKRHLAGLLSTNDIQKVSEYVQVKSNLKGFDRLLSTDNFQNVRLFGRLYKIIVHFEDL